MTSASEKNDTLSGKPDGLSMSSSASGIQFPKRSLPYVSCLWGGVSVVCNGLEHNLQTL